MTELRLGLYNDYQTSGGGRRFNDQLFDALQSVPGCRCVELGSDSVHTASVDVVVFTGTYATATPGTPSVLWPLNVAPLEPATIKRSSTSIKSFARYRLLQYKVGRSLRHVDATVFGSEYAQGLHHRRFPAISDKPSTVIPGGAPSLDIPSDIPRIGPASGPILYVSHLYPYKMIAEAIEGHRLAKAADPTVPPLHIAGKNADSRYYRRIAAAAAANPDALILGNLDAPDLLDRYSDASMVLFTSSSENAGSFGLFDAFHLGKATISSNMSSMPEICRDAVNYIDPTSPASIAEGILTVHQQQGVREDLSRRSLLHARGSLTWRDRASRLIEFIEAEVHHVQ